MLVVDKLKKSYGKNLIIKGIDLQVNDGEIFGFIGHNGAGKTTTIKCIIGIVDFEEGDININGLSIKSNPVECKKIMAYIPDNPDVYDYMSGIKYLQFIASVYGMSKENFNSEVSSLAKDFAIYDKLNDPIKTYSHGMKQKLVLISAFMHKPKLLVLDEPFVGLDPQSAFILKNKMKEFCNEGNMIFFSTHVLEVAEKLCHKVAIIKDGNIIVSGSTDEIVKEGKSLEDIFLESNHE